MLLESYGVGMFVKTEEQTAGGAGMDGLAEDVLSILEAEGIALSYGAVESKTGEMAEGEYRPSTRTIVIDKALQGYPDEPLTIAHEIGHHFDLIEWKCSHPEQVQLT
jgi:hypothetical protein